MRSRFRRGSERVFSVDLVVHQLDSIPAIHRLLHVHWRARRAIPSEGRTPSLAVEPGNVVRWNSAIHFTVSIPADPADPILLQPSPLALQLRSERRGRWLSTISFQAEGLVEVDLSQVAAVGFVSRNYLVQDSLLNTTLKLSIRVTHQSGDKIFRTRTLAAAPLPAAHDAADTGPDDDSTGTLPPVARDVNLRPPLSVDGRVERTVSAPFDSAGGGIGMPAAALPGLSGTTSASASTSVLYASADGDRTSSGFVTNDSPSTVLENSIPNPEIVQRRVYGKMFEAQLRDDWPAHIVASRVDPTDAVNQVYAAVCAADGIGIAGAGAGVEFVSRNVPELPSADKTLSLELLIESRNGVPVPQSVPVAEMRPTRKLSARSPHLSVRSSSMGEIAELAKLGS